MFHYFSSFYRFLFYIYFEAISLPSPLPVNHAYCLQLAYCIFSTHHWQEFACSNGKLRDIGGIWRLLTIRMAIVFKKWWIIRCKGVLISRNLVFMILVVVIEYCIRRILNRISERWEVRSWVLVHLDFEYNFISLRGLLAKFPYTRVRIFYF